MKIKIGDVIYDSEKEPILITLSEEEKTQIKNMKGLKKYCSFPESMSLDDVSKFMEDSRLKEQKIEFDKKLSSDMVKAIGREMLNTRNVVVEVREITSDFQVVTSYYSNYNSIPVLDQQEYSYSVYYNWKPTCYTARTLEQAVFIIGLLFKLDCAKDKDLAFIRYDESIEMLENMIAMINTHIKE